MLTKIHKYTYIRITTRIMSHKYMFVRIKVNTGSLLQKHTASL